MTTKVDSKGTYVEMVNEEALKNLQITHNDKTYEILWIKNSRGVTVGREELLKLSEKEKYDLLSTAKKTIEVFADFQKAEGVKGLKKAHSFTLSFNASTHEISEISFKALSTSSEQKISIDFKTYEKTAGDKLKEATAPLGNAIHALLGTKPQTLKTIPKKPELVDPTKALDDAVMPGNYLPSADKSMILLEKENGTYKLHNKARLTLDQPIDQLSIGHLDNFQIVLQIDTNLSQRIIPTTDAHLAAMKHILQSVAVREESDPDEFFSFEETDEFFSFEEMTE